MRGVECFILFLIIITTCSTYYLHWAQTTIEDKTVSKARFRSSSDNRLVSTVGNHTIPFKKVLTMYVLTTGERTFISPTWATVTMVYGTVQKGTEAPTFDEGYGPKTWPEGARHVADGHVTIWKKIAEECDGWCLVAEDDAVWPSLPPPPFPKSGYVSLFKESVCLAATQDYSQDYRQVVKTSIPGKCMPYGAVAYAMTGAFAKSLLLKLPMSKPVDHYIWKRAVVQSQGYVSTVYTVQHKKGKSLRQTVKNTKKRQQNKSVIAKRVKLLTVENFEQVLSGPNEGEHTKKKLQNKSVIAKQVKLLAVENFEQVLLGPNEGEHIKFDKSWSRLNKFITSNGSFLKLGTENIAHEFLYWNIADVLGITEIMLGTPTIQVECHDMNRLEQQLHETYQYKLPIFGITTPFVSNVKSGWEYTSNCHDLDDLRTLYMLFIDYLVGHSDRPSNCHMVNGIVYAIDNDGITLDLELKTWNNNIQENILKRALKDNSQFIHAKLSHLPLTSLTMSSLTSRMSVFATCDSSLTEHIQTLIQSILGRRDHFLEPLRQTKLTIYEKYHDELSLSVHHRLKKYSFGPELHANALKNVLHELLIHVDVTMKESNIDYVIYSGTLLGAWRHHGFIPWDTDADVIILSNTLVTLIEYVETVKTNKNIRWIIRHGKHSDIIPIKVVDIKTGYYVDIFLCHKDGKYCHNRFSNRLKHSIKDLFPSRTCLFDKLKVQCPPQPATVLKTNYDSLQVPNKYKTIYKNMKLFSDVIWAHVLEPKTSKIAVAIPTYNRKGYVQLCATALQNTITSEDIWIFDDHSSTYSADELKKWFHTEHVQLNTERQKADKQGRAILEWFITSEYDWLVTLDSDLIVRPDWFQSLQEMLPQTQGVMSLYHSGNANHPTLTCGNSLCEMQSLGNAGIVWSKLLATKMLSEMSQSSGFDWGWSAWLQKQHISQYAAKDSLVLHVGMHGTWGTDSKREKSVGFDMSMLTDTVKELAEIYLKGMDPNQRPEISKNDKITVVRTVSDSTSDAEFILFVPENVATPTQEIQKTLARALKEHPSFDVVGGLGFSENRISHTCFNIQICHWSLLYHYEYSWSKGSFMQCDTTSHVFMTRKKWLSHIDFALGVLTPVDFFIKVKQMKGQIVSDVSQLLSIPPQLVKSGQYTRFVQKHGVDQIRNRYTDEVTDLCQGCDANILRDILNGHSWNKYGISMPNFAYKSYVEGFKKAIQFLNQHQMVYRLAGGSQLGLLKLGRLLPWDAGDVDIYVDVSPIGCIKWLKLLKQWADQNGYIHPHVDPAGRKCRNYGVYAMPIGSDVRDPFSLGLLSFMGHLNDKHIAPTTTLSAHGVDAQVSLHLWDTLQKKYDTELLSHKKHNRYGNKLTKCQHKWEHNCIIDTSGTHEDTCIEFTQFYNI